MSKKEEEKKQEGAAAKKDEKSLLPQDELVSNRCVNLNFLNLIITFQSEEDQLLKDKLELCVTRLSDSSAGLREKALNTIKEDVATATASMTSVPKPLKFMMPQYEALVKIYNDYTNNDQFKVSIGLKYFELIIKRTIWHPFYFFLTKIYN